MIRIPLFAPANRRKARPIPPPEVPAAAPVTPVEPPKPKPPIRVSPPPAPAQLRATGPLATNTPYGKPTAEIPHWQTEAIGTEWLTTETQRLHDLAALGGDHVAHHVIRTTDLP